MPTSQGGGREQMDFFLSIMCMYITPVWTQLAHLVTGPGSWGTFAERINGWMDAGKEGLMATPGLLEFRAPRYLFLKVDSTPWPWKMWSDAGFEL